MARAFAAGSARSRGTVAILRRLGLVALSLVFPIVAGHAQSVPIQSLTFDGNQNIDSSRLRSQLRISREGGWYQSDTLNAELRNLARFYQDEGFLHAKVGPPFVDFQTDPARGRVAVIRVPVSEGSLFTVGQIAVKNVQALKPATLMQMCPLRTGQAYSRRKVTEWQNKIEDGYHTMGYIRFESAVLENVHDLQKVVDCTLECREGNAYSVGKITIVGDESINRPDFKRHLLLGEGGLYNPEMVSLSLQFLNQMDVYRSITESDVEIKIDDASRLVDLTFHLILLRKRGPAPKSR